MSSIKDPGVIDAIAVDKSSNTLVLLAIDPFKWSIQEADHLKAIQEKMNTYVRFIESGEYREHYPDNEFDGFKIVLRFKYQFSKHGIKFFEGGKKQLKERGIDFEYSVVTQEEMPFNPDNFDPA